MVLYNVTVKIADDVEAEWLQWMKEVHIPDVINAGGFIDGKISRLLNVNDGDESTYVIQYTCQNLERYQHYIEHHSKALRDEHMEKYKNKFVAFRTVMEVL